MAAYFESIAPLNHVDKIKKPMFIVAGGNDPRVPYTESVQIKDKIKQNGGTIWFLMAKMKGMDSEKRITLTSNFTRPLNSLSSF